MINAKKELLDAIIGKEILWARVETATYYFGSVKVIELPMKPSKKEYNAFLDSFDFEYDPTSNDFTISGHIVFDDHYLVRSYDHDYSESCWEYTHIPKIPAHLVR